MFNRLVPVEGVPAPAGVAAIDGSWCLSPDGINCGEMPGDIMIDAGPYAGLNASWHPGVLTVHVDGVLVTVNTASLDDALALVRSLRLNQPRERQPTHTSAVVEGDADHGAGDERTRSRGRPGIGGREVVERHAEQRRRPPPACRRAATGTPAGTR